MFLLDVIDNLPRLRFSDAEIQIILWLLKQTGCRKVPTFYALRKMQQRLRERCNNPTVQIRTSLGNIMYSNDICSGIARVRVIFVTVHFVLTFLHFTRTLRILKYLHI